MSSYGAYLVETLVTLTAVCGLAFVVLWGARRLGAGRAMGPIELRGHLPLDARRSIYLVQVGTQVFVVAAADGTFAKLGEVDASALPVEQRPAQPTFGEVLSKALRPRRSRRTTGRAEDDR